MDLASRSHFFTLHFQKKVQGPHKLAPKIAAGLSTGSLENRKSNRNKIVTSRDGVPRLHIEFRQKDVYYFVQNFK